MLRLPMDADIHNNMDIITTNLTKSNLESPNHKSEVLRFEHEHKDILFKHECFLINGCIYEVNKKLGTGFLESVYQEALVIELSRKKIPFIKQQELEIIYDGIPLSNKFIADIICYDKIIIELKAVTKINNQHKAQLLNYLAVTGFKLGLLVNFNSFPKTEIIRIIR